MPDRPDPATPPRGTYNSIVTGQYSSWSGTFTYDDTTKEIVYTRSYPSEIYHSTNTAPGNGFTFGISDPHYTATFSSRHFAWHGDNNDKARYAAELFDCRPRVPRVLPEPHVGLTANGWTATQS